VGVERFVHFHLHVKILLDIVYHHITLPTRPRGRPRNRWQDEVSEDGSIVGGEEWQGLVYDREEWKRLLRTARNHRILHMAMD
jgi:hypothetical protein